AMEFVLFLIFETALAMAGGSERLPNTPCDIKELLRSDARSLFLIGRDWPIIPDSDGVAVLREEGKPGAIYDGQFRYDTFNIVEYQPWSNFKYKGRFVPNQSYWLKILNTREFLNGTNAQLPQVIMKVDYPAVEMIPFLTLDRANWSS